MFADIVAFFGLCNAFLSYLHVGLVRARLKRKATMTYALSTLLIPAPALPYITLGAIKNSKAQGSSVPIATNLLFLTAVIAILHLYGWIKSKDAEEGIRNVYVWGLFRLAMLLYVEALGGIFFVA